MAGPFVYRPPVDPVYYPHQFAYPQTPQYYPHNLQSSHPFNRDLRLPHPPHSQSGPRHHRPVPLPAVSTPGGYAPQNPQQEGRGSRRWAHPPQRSRSAPPVRNGQWVQVPPRPLREGHPHQRPGLNQQGQGHRLNNRPRVDNRVNAQARPNRDFSPIYIARWIDANFPRSDFVFDLSSSEYAPRIYQDRRLVRLAYTDLMRPATYPPTTRIKILIEAIPQWPCDVVPRSTRGAMSVITLRDVLRTLYKHFHQPISQYDWDVLVSGRRQAVRQAFWRRCMNIPDLYAEGVKRVDFLSGKTRMVGLRWVSRREGCEMMKLVLDYVPN
ncbi:hypothetical protein J132_02364 [Termitomyces sp. J132]|nr:hypothetical protein C0989_005830 [Termitomyces sp. Mn162]KAH0580739.1 hypothetical protein H2248_002225 [Termitomyces sp. 'cryptogamus']KNZ81167.1 hypothetical protein J132_02364 [Termitomyces sp. J132]